MTAVALVSAKGSPGVTTSALLLAALWPRPACLVEADPAGGDLRWWQTGDGGQPLRPDRGVVSLLSAARTASPDLPAAPGLPAPPAAAAFGLRAHAQLIPGGLPVLVGVSNPAQYRALAPSWPALGAAVTGDGELDAVLDAGRLTADPPAVGVLRALAIVLVVCRPTVSSVAHTRHALQALDVPTGPGAGGHRPVLGVLVVGSPADREQVRSSLPAAAAAGRPLPVWGLPDDPAGARGLAGVWTRRLDRSPLVAAGRRLATELADLAALPAPAAAGSAGPRPPALTGGPR